MSECFSCGKPVPESAKFCDECGMVANKIRRASGNKIPRFPVKHSKAPKFRYCDNCKSPISLDAALCESCGAEKQIGRASCRERVYVLV